ncbi:MAG: hypothetical protein M1395_09165 [Bacteroidetes bacterium]|jgi:hypothetical protein|nr:hypothetical protein [Bacteroidota bacterium]
MKQNKKRSQKPSSTRQSPRGPQKHPSQKKNQKGADTQLIISEIEVGIYEVDKIFEGQGDKLSDQYVMDSLNSFLKLIKEMTYESYAERLRDGSDDESDMMHINVVNRLSSTMEELDLHVTDAELSEAVKVVLVQVKKAKSPRSSRAYLDPLAKRLKEMGFKSDFLTESDVDGETIRLEDIENLEDLSLDEDDLDLDDFRP